MRAFGGPAQAGVAAAGPAPTCSSSPTWRRPKAWRALVAKLRAGALDRAEFEAAAQRVLDLRRELAPR